MEKMNSYNRCLETMYGLKRFGIKLELATIKSILKGLGNPQGGFESIHVAGTNGKGSVASALASILYEAGYNVGLYTSPHLIRFNERIRINEHQISNDEVVGAYQAVKRIRCMDREPTFFEFATAMALYEFGKKNVEWAVIETGMGGRFDATNVIIPALAVITNVSLEHREYLGNTLSRIATEKAGIIKNRIPVVTGIKQKQAISVVTEIAKAKSASLYRLGKDFRVKRQKSGTFSYFGIENIWHNLRAGLLGDHQISNAALVLSAIELLNQKNTAISLQCVKNGLAKMSWPGRLDIVSKDPLIVLDGAHNLDAARSLAGYLSANLAGYKITMVVGILNDKPYAAMLKSLLSISNRAILTRARIDRALDPERLYAVAKDHVSDLTIISNVSEAVKYAVDSAGTGEAICIAGSLYVVGEAMEAFEKGLMVSIKKPVAEEVFSA
jgi:dihydrofolate synthase/folylpolyglutamate synthase